MTLTCLYCELTFKDPELHREHYKTEWHRYNLKRKLVDLPPLSREEFDKRTSSKASPSKDKDKKVSLHCEICNKHFSSENALTNHLKSKKHLDKENYPVSNLDVKQQVLKEKPLSKISSTDEKNNLPLVEKDDDWSDCEDDGEWESCDESDGDEERFIVDTNDCLFCDHQSDSTEGNVSHMSKNHSFFIPFIESLIDLDGLIGFLAAKIHYGICLWCNGKGKWFESIKSVKQHMIDTGHCKMLFEGEALEDYARFYKIKEDVNDTREDSDKSDIDNKDEIEKCDKTKDNIKVATVFEMKKIQELLASSDYELKLPSKVTIGHRTLAVYFKQNLKPLSSDSKHKVRRVLEQYKALGYTGATGPAALQIARDMSYAQKKRQQYYLKLSMKKNKFQPHFRPQIMF
ncbi:zinc finger protein 622 [Caerostris extrusa]|uniref:Zinc finger protein 622 n=1 Tax=Caerostris extrusa TaxID=172846 RepID=A0AAV4MWJ2_CAEEX|nr:zinc finger protein 622 [Caerostris extrusa]